MARKKTDWKKISLVLPKNVEKNKSGEDALIYPVSANLFVIKKKTAGFYLIDQENDVVMSAETISCKAPVKINCFQSAESFDSKKILFKSLDKHSGKFQRATGGKKVTLLEVSGTVKIRVKTGEVEKRASPAGFVYALRYR